MDVWVDAEYGCVDVWMDVDECVEWDVYRSGGRWRQAECKAVLWLGVVKMVKLKLLDIGDGVPACYCSIRLSWHSSALQLLYVATVAFYCIVDVE